MTHILLWHLLFLRGRLYSLKLLYCHWFVSKYYVFIMNQALFSSELRYSNQNGKASVFMKLKSPLCLLLFCVGAAPTLQSWGNTLGLCTRRLFPVYSREHVLGIRLRVHLQSTCSSLFCNLLGLETYILISRDKSYVKEHNKWVIFDKVWHAWDKEDSRLPLRFLIQATGKMELLSAEIAKLQIL